MSVDSCLRIPIGSNSKDIANRLPFPESLPPKSDLSHRSTRLCSGFGRKSHPAQISGSYCNPTGRQPRDISPIVTRYASRLPFLYVPRATCCNTQDSPSPAWRDFRFLPATNAHACRALVWRTTVPTAITALGYLLHHGEAQQPLPRYRCPYLTTLAITRRPTRRRSTRSPCTEAPPHRTPRAKTTKLIDNALMITSPFVITFRSGDKVGLHSGPPCAHQSLSFNSC